MPMKENLCTVKKPVSLAAAVIMVFLVLTSCSSSPDKFQPLKAACPMETPLLCEPGKPYHTIDLLASPWELTDPKIYIYKGERRMLLVDNGRLVRDFPISLGFSPYGDKYMRGDGKTPEGEFFICNKNPYSKFYKSLGISYPSPRHAAEALREGRISPDEYRRILDAAGQNTLPPYNTTLGGAIFIHGGGTRGDWTEGCIALSNSIMDELFEIVPVGARVEILP